MKYLSDLDFDRDDATGGYRIYNHIFEDIPEEDLFKKISESIPHIVHHVDMDAILEGREKRLTIEESKNRGAELCKRFVEEFKTHQSDNQTGELEKEDFIKDDSIEF